MHTNKQRDPHLSSGGRRKGDWGEAGDAIRFLQDFDVGGWHNLLAFNPLTGKPVSGKTFKPGAWASIGGWINDHIALGHNLYFSPNEPKPGAPNKKLPKTDIGRIRAVHVDLDPKGGVAEFDAERLRLRALVDQVIGSGTPPTFTVDSDNGFQLHWRVETVEATPRNIRLAEDAGDALAYALKGDAVQNVDCIMRLPGTTNFPNSPKKLRGRVPQPAVLHRLGCSGKIFHLAQLAALYTPPKRDRPRNDAEAADRERLVIAADTFDELPDELRERFDTALDYSPDLKRLWEDGEKEGGDRSGSRMVASLGWRLASRGFSLMDFAPLAWVWAYTPANSGRSANASPRSLAMVWAKAQAVIRRGNFDSDEWFDRRAAAGAKADR